MLYVPVKFDLIPVLRDAGVSDGSIRRVLIEVAQKYTPILKRAAPVDTGRLKRSLRVELLLSDDGVALTSEVWYAGFVEYGTRKMRPRNYAASIVPDLINFANQLLRSILPTGTVTPADQGVRVSANTDELNTGQTKGRVSEVSFARIKTVSLQPLRISPIRIQPQMVSPTQVSSALVDPMTVEAIGVENTFNQP